ncbi:uncharacterized protein [Clytia hemisphaerica]|uniref:uncharacterized protein n=1 Tax=Clytia hemisphaerica TaxID=252671 RepID=UPI0034D5F738
MKINFEAYSEVLFIDATYKVNELRIPAYILLVEDSLGLSEVVGVALLVNETKQNVTWLIETFAALNNSEKLRVVMADKDINERKRISEILGVPILICLFHALKAFRREMGILEINKDLKTKAKELFEKMCYAYTEENFKLYESQFLGLDTESSPLITYYVKNWQPFTKDWVKCFKAQSGNFLNSTNNRLESFNSKLKSVIGLHCSLEEFIRGFFSVLSTLRTERDAIVAKEFQKVKVIVSENPIIITIKEYLTSFAAKFVCEEFNSFTKTTIRSYHHTTTTTCSCPFASSMRLPCRHIFLSRFETNCQFLFVEELCIKRWSKSYCLETQRLFKKSNGSNGYGAPINTTTRRPEKALNQAERFNKALGICKQLSSLVAEHGGETFVSRIKTLTCLQSIWERGEEARIISKSVVDPDSLNCSKPEHVDPDSLNCSKPEHVDPDSLNCSKPEHVDPDLLNCSKPEHADPDSLNCSKPEHVDPDSLNCSKPKHGMCFFDFSILSL